MTTKGYIKWLTKHQLNMLSAKEFPVGTFDSHKEAVITYKHNVIYPHATFNKAIPFHARIYVRYRIMQINKRQKLIQALDNSNLRR